jgi:hypothetical protein
MLTHKLNTLIHHCKASVTLSVNNHRDGYQTVEDYFQNLLQANVLQAEDFDEIPFEIYQQMRLTDTVVELYFYPDTPIGSYTIYHFDVELAVEEALRILKLKMSLRNLMAEKIVELIAAEQGHRAKYWNRVHFAATDKKAVPVFEVETWTLTDEDLIRYFQYLIMMRADIIGQSARDYLQDYYNNTKLEL